MDKTMDEMTRKEFGDGFEHVCIFLYVIVEESKGFECGSVLGGLG